MIVPNEVLIGTAWIRRQDKLIFDPSTGGNVYRTRGDHPNRPRVAPDAGIITQDDRTDQHSPVGDSAPVPKNRGPGDPSVLPYFNVVTGPNARRQ